MTFRDSLVIVDPWGEQLYQFAGNFPSFHMVSFMSSETLVLDEPGHLVTLFSELFESTQT